MTFETERLIHENTPTPAQLRRLAFIGLGSAVSRKTIRNARHLKMKHYFVEETSELYGNVDASENYPVSVNRRMAMHFGVVPNQYDDAGTAHLHYFDTHRYQRVPGEHYSAMQSVYRFAWSRGEVLLAEKTLRLLCSNEPAPRTLDSYFDNISIPDTTATMIGIEDDMRMVSAEECDDVINEASHYFSLVKRG